MTALRWGMARQGGYRQDVVQSLGRHDRENWPWQDALVGGLEGPVDT